MSDPHFSLKKKQMGLFTTDGETREMKYTPRMFTVERGRQKEGGRTSTVRPQSNIYPKQL